MKIRRLNGRLVEATYVRHLRTLTGNPGSGAHSYDVDYFRLSTGDLIQCMSKECDSRDVPREVDPEKDHYPGFPAGA